MIVKQLQIQNYKGIERLAFDLANRLNVFIGDNGTGKTSILDVLAILLSRLTSRVVNHKGTGRLISAADIRSGANKASAQISALIGDENVDWEISRYRRSGNKQSINGLDRLKDAAQSIRSDCLENMERCSIPLAVLYGVNRAVVNVPLRIKKKHLFEPIYAYDDSLSSQRRENDFKLFFEWFRNREDLENENIRDDRCYRDRQLQAVRDALEGLMPEYADLKVKRDPLRMIVRKSQLELRIESLSDGEKCLIAMCGDMARRLAMANPGLENPLNGKGVIMIDELELHLHPQWQKRVLGRLLDTFPNCQFFITTHSPQILGEIRLDETRAVFNLKYNSALDILEYYTLNQALGLEVGDILEEIMGVDRVNAEIKMDLHEVFDCIDNDKFDLARVKMDALRERTNGDFPELLKAETMMSMLAED